MSISGGLHLAIKRGQQVRCEALQIFSKNSNQWKSKPLQQQEIAEFKKIYQQWGNYTILVHDSYLINLGSPNEEDRQRSMNAFLDEMERCELLDLPYLIFHPGAHLGGGEDEGCRLIAECLNQVFLKASGFKVKLLMETTAGQGTNIGYKFEHLRKILDLLKFPEKIGICVDTCHIFAAGYDIRTKEGYDRTFEFFDQIIGIDFIKAFHLNDSKKGFLSRVDRHEHIGKGYIGIDAFRFLMNDSRFRTIPMVLETPKGETLKEDAENLAVLRHLIHPQSPSHQWRGSGGG